jgi:BlaI family transcriptional regulator, penicillinase repressor
MDVSLGERELDVLGVLWQHGAGTVAEVRDRLPDDLAYNTVLTILRNLEAKGVVAHEEEGRQHRYRAAIAQEQVQGSLLTRLVDKIFLGSPLNLMAHLVEHDRLSADDVRALQQLIDSRLAARADAAPATKPVRSRKAR